MQERCLKRENIMNRRSFIASFAALLCLFQAVAPAADIKQAFAAEQTLTVTNLHSLASSATAGWQGAAIDNTSNLYPETEISIVLDFANTAPANSKGVY